MNKCLDGLNKSNVVIPQVMLDEEKLEMESAARVAEPRNTESFDFSRYHTISEVSARWEGKGFVHRKNDFMKLRPIFNPDGEIFLQLKQFTKTSLFVVIFYPFVIVCVHLL